MRWAEARSLLVHTQYFGIRSGKPTETACAFRLRLFSGEQRTSHFQRVESLHGPKADLDQRRRSNLDFSWPIVRAGSWWSGN